MSDTEETYQDESQGRPSGFHAPQIPMGDDAEAVRVMEEAKRRKDEKLADDLAEFTESRKEQKAAEEEEIRALKEKREQRLKERAEDEKRWAEQRQQEEARRKAEEEERKRKKQEEEDKRKAERDRKRREAEKRVLSKKPNFKIVKREDGTQYEEPIIKEEDDNKPKQKSKEELEKEKRAVLEQRIKPLGIDGADKAKLIEKANELHEHLLQLASNQYDLEDSFKRQQYDMIELAERARAMSKTKSRRGVSSVQIDESFDRLADKFSHAPPKIRLCSKYDRHTDTRSYDQRKKMYEDLSTPPSPPPIQRMRPVPQENEDAEDSAE